MIIGVKGTKDAPGANDGGMCLECQYPKAGAKHENIKNIEDKKRLFQGVVYSAL